MEEKTLFEKIIDGEIPATFIYKDDMCVAFLDINPVNPGHTLVIPRQPYRNLYEIPETVTGHLFCIAQKIARAQKQALLAEGVNIMMNNDATAGQVVFHAHIHVIPRYKDDGYSHWEGRGNYEDDEAVRIAEKIQHALH
jgi:histidine triad (HIT) family protein